jgi:hypothetical protein
MQNAGFTGLGAMGAPMAKWIKGPRRTELPQWVLFAYTDSIWDQGG